MTVSFLIPILALTIPVHVDTAAKPLAADWICTGGIPLHDGDLKDADRSRLQLLDAKGNVVPLQTRPLAWWNAEDAVKWLELAFPVRGGSVDPQFTLTLAETSRKKNDVSVRDDGTTLTVDGGSIRLTFDRRTASLVDKVEDGQGKRLLETALDSYVIVRDFQDGKRSGRYTTGWGDGKTLKVERRGPVDVTILVRTEHFTDDGRHTAVVDARVTLAANLPRFKVFHTAYVTENTAVTVFPGYGLEFASAGVKSVDYGVDGQLLHGSTPFSLRQDNDATATYPKFQDFAPVAKVKGGTGGRRADGWLDVGGVKVAVRRFFEEYPSGFKVAKDGAVKIEFWPEDKPEPLDFRRIDQRLPTDWGDFRATESKKIRGYEYAMDVFHRQMTKLQELRSSAFGRARSHEVWFDFTMGLSGAVVRACAEQPLMPFVSGKWNCETRALGLVAPENRASHPGIERMWDVVFEAMWKHQTEWFNWYGELNWGDWQSDYNRKEDRWANYDVKYGWRKGGMDIPYTQLLWYFRGGRRFYFNLGEPAVLNLADLSSAHGRAYENEALVPRWWNSSGTSRYGADRFCPGAGQDPEHLFAHSIQLGWLLTGNDYYRDLIADFADSYMRFLKQFVYDKYNAPHKLHYHGRESDMPLRLACCAYENDPKNPRWRDFLDEMADMFVCSFDSVRMGEDGQPYRSCNGLKVTQFFNSLYHLPALNCLMSVRKDARLETAIRKAVPLYAEETSNASGFAWLAALTGNRKYAKFAARQVCLFANYRKRTDPVDKGVLVSPETMGGTYSCYPTMLWAADRAAECPDRYEVEENNYYPVSLPPCGEIVPADERTCVCMKRPVPVQGRSASDRNGLETYVFDFGPREKTAEGTIPVGLDFYPSTVSMGGFAGGLPFGCRAMFNGTWFEVWKRPLEFKADDAFRFPLDAGARTIALLTGVCTGVDPFHDRPGLEVVIADAAGQETVCPLENMVHYQHRSFNRLYCDRKYNAGRLNGLNLSVVRFPVPNGSKSFVLRDTGAGAKVVVFGLSVIGPDAEPAGGLRFSLVRKNERPGAPVTVRANGRTVLASVVPLAERTEYVVPWSGPIPRKLELSAGVFSHKSGSFRGDYEFVPRPSAPAFSSPSAADGPAEVVFGWTMPFEGRPLYIRTNTELVKAKGVTAYESALGWDGAYLEEADRICFQADLPDGLWDVELHLSNTSFCRGAAKAWVSLQGQTEKEIVLPQFESPAAGGLANSRVPRHCIVRGRAHGTLVVTVRGLPKGRRAFDDAYGLNAIIVRRSADKSGKEGVLSIEREVLPWERTDFPINRFGAEEGEGELCTDAIAQAVEACVRKGGGRITVPHGRWLTGPIHLRSNVELHLEEGATLVFTDDREKYLPPVRVGYEGREVLNYSPLIYAFGATNVSITGSGTLQAKTDGWFLPFFRALNDGSLRKAQAVMMEWGERDVPVDRRDATKLSVVMRPHFIEFNRCRDVRLEGFAIRRSPFWCVHPYVSTNVVIRGLDICARECNNDGIDPDSCNEVLIENCRLEQGDDGIAIKSGRDRDGRRLGIPCENVEVHDISIGRRCPSLCSVGSEVSGGIRNVRVHDCHVGTVGRLGYVKTGPTRGGYVKDVSFENLSAEEVQIEPFNIRTNHWADPAVLVANGRHETLLGRIATNAVTALRAPFNVRPIASHGALFPLIDGESEAFDKTLAVLARYGARATFVFRGIPDARACARARVAASGGHSVAVGSKLGIPSFLGSGRGTYDYAPSEMTMPRAALREVGVSPGIWAFPEDDWTQYTDYLVASWEFPVRIGCVKSLDKALFPLSAPDPTRLIRYVRFSSRDIQGVLGAVAKDNLGIAFFESDGSELEELLSTANGLGVRIVGLDEMKGSAGC